MLERELGNFPSLSPKQYFDLVRSNRPALTLKVKIDFFSLLMCCSWALVKDREIAKKMTTFIEINTIGVSKDSQIRAAKILQTVSDSCENANQKEPESFFDYSYKFMDERWKKIREAVNKTELFSLPDFSLETCSFSGRTFGQLPGNFTIIIVSKYSK